LKEKKKETITMTLTLCAALMQTVLLATPTDNTETYVEARRKTTETGRPMVVMVSTDWCGPCQSMKRNVLPRLRERGLFKKVAFAQVNADRDGELAKELTGGGPVPQLVMYRRTERGWLRRKLIGGQSVEKVEQFIKEGLVMDETEHKSGKIIIDDDFDLLDFFFMEMYEEAAKSSDTKAG
jgi:thiol-disulfide isomerase/thioredoxin